MKRAGKIAALLLGTVVVVPLMTVASAGVGAFLGLYYMARCVFDAMHDA